MLVPLVRGGIDYRDRRNNRIYRFFVHVGHRGSDQNTMLIEAFTNVRHVGPGQTHATIAAATAAASAGDLIVVHAATYDETGIGKQDVAYYFAPGAIVTNTLTNAQIFVGGNIRYRVFGFGQFTQAHASNTEMVMTLANFSDIEIQAELFQCTNGNIVTAGGAVTGGEIRIRAKKIGCTSVFNMAGGMNVFIDVEQATASLLFNSNHANNRCTLNAGMCTLNEVTCTAGNAGRLMLTGNYHLTHALTNGLSPSAAQIFMLRSGAMHAPAGRLTLSGVGTFYVAGDFAYDQQFATAPIIHPAGRAFVETNVLAISTQQVFTLSAGPVNNITGKQLSALVWKRDDPTQRDVITVTNYVGSSKTITLERAPAFTIAAGDRVRLVAGDVMIGGDLVCQLTSGALLSIGEAVADQPDIAANLLSMPRGGNVCLQIAVTSAIGPMNFTADPSAEIDTTNNNVYNGMFVVPNDGQYKGVPKKITAYTAGVRAFVVESPGWPTALAAATKCTVIGK